MDDVEAIAALRDPVRRRLYEYVAAQDHEVSRNEAAEAMGVQRTLAAFHLDKLAEAGLLETTGRRLTGRSGPGAGRPAKLYRRAAAERVVSVPPRDYRTAAELLAEAAEEAELDERLWRAARLRGRELARDAGPVRGLDEAEALLARRGYEPVREQTPAGAVLRMRNCPFHVLSERFPPLVCGMNLALLEGAFEGSADLAPRMDPRPGWCCTVLAASKNNED
ncbi:Predicted transcriptional regulator, ArsR family [Thermomonospora echinospora]|uniref:Predicted transcriptional regulator, ArsR family n=1 Tax=Thermomonospora echinospora TaxID=1992 RepID=A0A1H6C302_9ACTN|nr:helix-turn-helix domain-containing protein [Thermomonospora echinospora]SEG66756.1 Predicted transcriptional regulator, ArsR family [Thermomonospora echinospora]